MSSERLYSVEKFLYREAALLDDWDLDEWLALFDNPCLYQIPNPSNPRDSGPEEVVFFVADTFERLRGRIERLKKKNAHVEYPHSSTLHNVTNVRILDEDSDSISVGANFTVYRTKNDITDTFFGRYRYRLKPAENEFKILEKCVYLSFDVLRPQRMISVIL